MRDFEDTMRRFNMYLVGVLEEKKGKNKLEGIMAEKFPELLKDNHPHTQEAK